MKHLTNQGTSSHWSKNHIKNQCCHKAVLHNDCPPWPHTPRDVEGYCHCITRVPKLWQLKNHLFISLSPNNYHTCMTKVHSSDQTIKSAFQFHYIFLICLKVWMNDLTAAGRVSFGSSLPWWCSPFDLVGAGGGCESVAGYVAFTLPGDVEYPHRSAWIALLRITTAKRVIVCVLFSAVCFSLVNSKELIHYSI